MKQNELFWFTWENMKTLFDPYGNRKWLNWQEREAFLKAVQSCPDVGKKVFCLTLFYTGCRISEALELTGDRVDVSEGVIILRTLKRRNPSLFRLIPIPPLLANLLNDLVKKRERRIWQFSRPTGYRLIRKYMTMAGISGIRSSPKGLRHSYAVACVSKGVPVTTVQRWMGHARLETTAIYLNTIGEEDRRQASKIWPKNVKRLAE